MKADRRQFCGALVAGMALAAGAGGCGGGQNPPPKEDPGGKAGGGGAAVTSTRELIFSFTGLLAAEVEESERKELTVSLLDPAQVMITDEHTPQLLVRLADYVWPYQFGTEGNGPKLVAPRMHHRPPQIIRIGGETYGMWGLQRTMLWMGEAKQKALDAVPKEKTSFAFKKLGADVTQKPANEAGWAGREWFVTRKDVCEAYERVYNEKCPDPERVKYPEATSQFQLSSGAGAGLAPITDCERGRNCRLGDIKETTLLRKFGAEFQVVYGASADTTDICLSPINMNTGKPAAPYGLVIRLRTKPGVPAPVSVVNSPVSHNSSDHFPAYSALLKLDKPVCLFVYEDKACAPSVKPDASYSAYVAEEHEMQLKALKHQKGSYDMDACKAQTKGAPNPPDGGCVPLFIEVS
jgi:hypothetical protein